MSLVRRLALVGLIVALVASAGLGIYAFAPSESERPLTADEVDLAPLDAVAPSTWEALRSKRIYFGHQSVGSNIIAGVEEILRRKPNIGLRVAKAEGADRFAQSGLIHGPIGKNEDIEAKVRDFESIVTAPEAAALDMALMKFCYADLKRHEDYVKIVTLYEAMIDRVAASRPTLRVLHMTVPLTGIAPGPKGRVKRLIGRVPLNENLLREMHEGWLRDLDREGTFSVGHVESLQRDDAQAMLVDDEGLTHPCLATCLTNDGGHLNEGGSVLVAREFLLFLARQCETAPAAGSATP